MDDRTRRKETIARSRTPMKCVPYQEIIQSLYKAKVVKFDKIRNRQTLTSIAKAMKSTCLAVQASPIERSRPNEVGNDMERFVLQALNGSDLKAEAPRTKAGKRKSVGYPDIRIEATRGPPIYLEVKTYNARNRNSTQRSFFFSPTDDPKITEDGFHLLVGFEIERDGNRFTPVAYEIVDLFDLECDLKYEFNSNNLRLYQPERILKEGRVSKK